MPETSAPSPRLPDLPPQIYTALNILSAAVSNTPQTRAAHADCEQALQMIAQYCVQVHQSLSSPKASEVKPEKLEELPPDKAN